MQYIVFFQTLQKELQECLSSVKQMDEATQPVMSGIGSDRQLLILQTVTRLLSRLQSAEDDATQSEKNLIKRTEDLTAYQVCPRNSTVAALLLFVLLLSGY